LALIPRFGLVGAAIAALAGVTVVGVLMIVEVRITAQVFAFGWSTLKPFVAGAIMLTAELGAGGQIHAAALRIPLVILAGTVCYGGALFSLGLAPEDRRLLSAAWNRLRR